MSRSRLHDDIAACRAAHVRLGAVIAPLTDDQARRPSLLPGWSIGYVLTHLARNADSVLRRLDGAARGAVVDQYPGGKEGRQAEIDAGSGRSIAALVADVTESSAAVDAAFESFSPEHWNRTARAVSGDEHPVSELPFQRWREVEVHLVDLGLRYGPTDWPSELVERWLPGLLGGLPQRTDQRALMAWALRRGPAPDLDPY